LLDKIKKFSLQAKLKLGLTVIQVISLIVVLLSINFLVPQTNQNL